MMGKNVSLKSGSLKNLFAKLTAPSTSYGCLVRLYRRLAISPRLTCSLTRPGYFPEMMMDGITDQQTTDLLSLYLSDLVAFIVARKKSFLDKKAFKLHRIPEQYH